MLKIYHHITITLFIILTSCHHRTTEIVYNPKAIDLNNKAVQYIKIQKFDSALIYLDKAIIIDSTFYLAYANKSTVYTSVKDFKNALLAAQKEISVKPDLAEGWIRIGMLNKELDDTLTAFKCYKKSIEILDERISKPDNQKNLKANKLNRALAYILLGQEEIGENEIKKLIVLYPSDKSLEGFSKLSKQEYLKQIFNAE